MINKLEEDLNNDSIYIFFCGKSFLDDLKYIKADKNRYDNK